HTRSTRDWSFRRVLFRSLRLAVDSRYSQHVLLARGKGLADYAVTLGALDPGRHRLTVELDSTLSAAHAFPPTVTGVELRIVDREIGRASCRERGADGGDG